MQLVLIQISRRILSKCGVCHAIQISSKFEVYLLLQYFHLFNIAFESGVFFCFFFSFYCLYSYNILFYNW